MKRSLILFAPAAALATFLLAAQGAFADDTKHISDGAAKGQATEGEVHPDQQGGAGKDHQPHATHHAKTLHHPKKHVKTTGHKAPAHKAPAHTEHRDNKPGNGKGTDDMAVKGSGVPAGPDQPCKPPSCTEIKPK
jgi:hypothetical protein